MVKQILLVGLLLVVAVTAFPQFQPRREQSRRQAPAPQGQENMNPGLIRSENVNPGTGNFNWGYETEDHQTQDVVGRLKKAYPDKPEIIAIDGSHSHLDAFGVKVTTTYTADENGYREMRKYDQK